jgi:hypothetical protein
MWRCWWSLFVAVLSLWLGASGLRGLFPNEEIFQVVSRYGLWAMISWIALCVIWIRRWWIAISVSLLVGPLVLGALAWDTIWATPLPIGDQIFRAVVFFISTLCLWVMFWIAEEERHWSPEQREAASATNEVFNPPGVRWMGG